MTLLGQNVNAYREPRHDGSKMDFAELLAYVAAVEGIDRIRYTTSHPIDFSDSLVEAYREIPELVSHLHLPVQSGSDRILGLMKRRYRVTEYEDIIAACAALARISVYRPISLWDSPVNRTQTLRRRLR